MFPRSLAWIPALAALPAASPPTVVQAWEARLQRDPAGTVAALADPAGPLASAWPAVSGTLQRPSVFALTVQLDPAAGVAQWSGTLTWTAPAATDLVVLRLPAEQLGGEVSGLRVDGRPATIDRGLVRVPRALQAGETVALRISGTTSVDGDQEQRLRRRPGLLTLAGWLPLPTPWGRERDQRVWTGVSDPGAHEAMIFLVDVRAPPGWTVLFPGEPIDGGHAAVGVRELPIVAMHAWRWVARPGVRVWTEDGQGAWALAAAAARAREELTRRHGPLSIPRLDVVASTDPGSGVELPGIILVPAERSVYDDHIVAHEVAHQWWYGEVGSDALLEPWVDESTASGAASVAAPDALDAWPPAERRAPTASPAEALGDDFGRVYVQGRAYYLELATRPAELDRALARWLSEHRWGFATGDQLRRTLAEEVGADVERAAWCRWMTADPVADGCPAVTAAGP